MPPTDNKTALPTVLAAKKLGIKSIYEYRGKWHYTDDCMTPWSFLTELYNHRHHFELQVAKKADAVFTISEALREDLVAQGVDKQKITVLPNAVDTAHFKALETDETLKSSLGLNGRKVLGFIGNIAPYEGLPILIDAVLELNMRGEKVSLVVVGDGEHLSMLKKHHAARGNHPAIVFTGKIPFDKIPRYYSIMDVMSFPRVDAKVSHCTPSSKPMEAMAMKKPVIVSRVTTLCDIVTDEDTGLVCEPNNVENLTEQLGRLLTDRTLRERIAENAFQWVHDEGNWAKNSELILRVYESLLKQ